MAQRSMKGAEYRSCKQCSGIIVTSLMISEYPFYELVATR
jgi:hypothetical protein